MTALHRLKQKMAALAAATQGVAMIEFAIVFPFFFLLLFGGIEITRLLIIQQQLERAGYTLADIVTQYTPATNARSAGEISKTELVNNVFPQLSRIMSPYDDPERQAIIITSIKKTAGQKRIQWQVASAEDSLSGCDDLPTPNCVKSIVNDLAPGLISSAVVNTATTFPAAQDQLFDSLPDGANIIVSEVFYFYQPILQTLLQQVGAAGGDGAAGFSFVAEPRVYVKRTYFSPRYSDMVYLPPDFPPPP